MSLGLGMSVKSPSNQPWTPMRLPNLIHWFRYGTGISANDDGNITGWHDSKGALVATADGAANNSPDITSARLVSFNHASNFFKFKLDGSNSDITLGAFSLYFRINFDSGDTIGAEDLIEKDTNNFFKLTSPTTARYKIGGTRHDFTFSEIAEGTPFVIGGERNSEGAISVYVDNEAATADEGEGTQDVGETVSLSQFGKPTNNSYWYEVVICNDALSSGHREILYKYLSGL
jgi:hypothetical protein